MFQTDQSLLSYLFFLELEGYGLGIIIIFFLISLYFVFVFGGFPGHFSFLYFFLKSYNLIFKILSKQIF